MGLGWVISIEMRALIGSPHLCQIGWVEKTDQSRKSISKTALCFRSGDSGESGAKKQDAKKKMDELQNRIEVGGHVKTTDRTQEYL